MAAEYEAPIGGGAYHKWTHTGQEFVGVFLGKEPSVGGRYAGENLIFRTANGVMKVGLTAGLYGAFGRVGVAAPATVGRQYKLVYHGNKKSKTGNDFKDITTFPAKAGTEDLEEVPF
jgi:hypothetical protein